MLLQVCVALRRDVFLVQQCQHTAVFYFDFFFPPLFHHYSILLEIHILPILVANNIQQVHWCLCSPYSTAGVTNLFELESNFIDTESYEGQPIHVSEALM